MNDFKELAKITKSRRAKINSLYDFLYENKNCEILEKLIKISGLKNDKTTRLALLRRIVDLKEENLIKELEKTNLSEEKINEIKHEIYEEIARFYETENEELLLQISNEKILNDFYLNLIKAVHEIGRVMNKFEIIWTKKIIEENAKFLRQKFQNLADALEFLRKNEFFQKNEANKPCERSYGVLIKRGENLAFVPYAVGFESEILELKNAFEKALENLKKFAKNEEEFVYLNYFSKLKNAFCERENDKVISAWQETEFAWMDIKTPLQIGHPLEYYEDNFTHAVALEWDIRLSDEAEFNKENFTSCIKSSFLRIYESLNLTDENLKNEVLHNLEKTQLYICTPMIFYGANLRGLFSAQVVPNDEFVSSKAGKKIFAFLNFIYESAKTKPFMKISSEIFEPEFLNFGREILFFKEKIWKKIYEISTIGHEFGHIFFIDKNSEELMNKSGFFKNIEEYKATTGGLINFFFNEDEELKMGVFHDLIKRAVGLIAWQKVNEVQAYYTEGLIHLSLLFQTGALKFDKKAKLKIDFSLEAYENFKILCIKNYQKLALFYAQKKDAWEFLSEFCLFENGIFLPKMKECREFVEFYYDLYEKIGNQIDESEDLKNYKIAAKKQNLD